MNLAKKMGLGLACLHGLTEVTSLSAASPPVRPNVLLIYADDMGYGDLGVQNPESRIPTPHPDPASRPARPGRHAFHRCAQRLRRVYPQSLLLVDRPLRLAASGEYCPGLADNTLVIFSSDNGPERYAYPRIRGTGHDSRGGLRGVKRDIWEGGHRVPFLVRWPGVIESGLVNDALISQIDLMATLANIIGIELPEDAAEDSYDLSRLLRVIRQSPHTAPRFRNHSPSKPESNTEEK